MTDPELELRAKHIRATCIEMACRAKEGHLNGVLSIVDVLTCLVHDWMRWEPAHPQCPERDRLVFSKGHGCTALYAVLADRGFIPKAWLPLYARDDSPLPNHPCKHALPVLECSSGSLGHGLGLAAGMAYGLRLDNNPGRVAAILSDGECNEGSTWEAAMFAAAQHLDQVTAIVDYNRIQAVARTNVVNGNTSFEDKFRAFGWSAITIDGHSLSEIRAALSRLPFTHGKPSAIIARTVAGRGVSFMEDQVLWHYRAPSQDDMQKALEELQIMPSLDSN